MAKVFAFLGAAAGVLGVGLMCAAVLHAQAQQPQTWPAVDSKPAAGAKAAVARSFGYYIEFRVAQIGTYGHSYVAYGRLNARGEPAEFHYADRHPVGNYFLMMVGHVVPVAANKKWDPEVLTLPIATSFRRNLSAAEYKKLLEAIRRARASEQYWNVVSNNCNHFVAELAQAIGMRVPAGLQVSYLFIPALRDLNQRSP